MTQHPLAESGNFAGQNDNLGANTLHDTEDQSTHYHQSLPVRVSTPVDEVPHLNDSYAHARNNPTIPRKHTTANGPNGTSNNTVPQLQTNGMSSRPSRPAAVRTPSNAYAPPRRPNQFSLNNTSSRHRASSANRNRRSANAEYRAQEKAYVQRIRQDAPDPDEFYASEMRTPSLGYTTDSETEDESPSTADLFEGDPYEQDTLLFYGNDEMEPSEEELKIPANRERLEWHWMLASVLTGDVVKQEKKRLIGGNEQQTDTALKAEIWLGIRAKLLGRTIQAQRRIIEDSRSRIKSVIESLITFEIKGEAEVGKSPMEQVEDAINNIDKCESLYPNIGALEAANPKVATAEYRESCEAILAWHNTTRLINTALSILKAWVGNDELNFTKAHVRDPNESHLTDDSSFIDRILKEDGLKSLLGESSLLVKLHEVIKKAKGSLIENAKRFADRHLPPYIEELLTLINFPSRLVQDIIGIRLLYANQIEESSRQDPVSTEQMIAQFKILLNLAIRIKEVYTLVIQPEPGWEPPPCIEENFDTVVLDALKFYFKLLSLKLAVNKNTFKEAEILEHEWDFANKLGKYLEGGDLVVAEQFGALTSASLERLTSSFGRELKRPPKMKSGAELEKRYKLMLDSVRVRQRKLFRFSRILNQQLENSTEYNISMTPGDLHELYDALSYSGHVLIEGSASKTSSGPQVFASMPLNGRPKEVQSLLATCYHAEDSLEDPACPYLLVLRPEHPIPWRGEVLKEDLQQPDLNLKVGRLRLIAGGSQQRLVNANLKFISTLGIELTKVAEQRANLPSVNNELNKIKRTTYKLSDTIMKSVQLIREQTKGLDCHELIQTCFAFATEFGQRSLFYMDQSRRASTNLRLTQLALDWVAFISDDCIASDRKTFRWAVIALEFAMMMTRGQNILSLSEEDFKRLRTKVSRCMSLLISHFDIMGARSSMAAQAEKERMDALMGKMRFDVSKIQDDETSAAMVRQQRMEQLSEIDEFCKAKEAERQALGRVLEDSNEADRALFYLSASATNVVLRWQQGQFVGGGTFGSVYAAVNLDTGQLMAVKEIRLQDPQMIPTIVQQIRDEMGVLQVLDHPNIVSYYGIEPHRDKVYIFMEYCSGGSLAGLLEHGRIEDETVIQVYALQMLEGLGYLHESGVVHRDIKPENILLDHNGVIKFVDFGAAKVIAKQGKTLAADHKQTRQKSMTGTPMYMSPEVIKGENKGRLGAADIWSLGCVILEMATGRRPWATLDNEWAIMYNIAQGNPPQLPTKDQLSPSGIDFLTKCFERDPAKRASASELLLHDWIMILRSQLSLDPATPSESSASAPSSTLSSRQNSMNPVA